MWFPDKNLNGESQCPWRYLHLDNVSIPRSSLISIGGFDQHTFGPGTTAVFELGLRLQKQLGVNITHDPTIRVQCTTIPDLNAVRHRAYQLGYSDYLCWQKHPYEKSFALENVEHPHQTQAFLELRQELIQRQTNIRYAIEVINKQWPLLNKNGNWGEDHLHPLIHAICAYESLKGLVHASTHLPFMPDEDEADFISELTTIVMCNYNGLPSLKKAIHSLREHTTGPVELIVVDNGSADGSPDWLKSQTDIRPVLLPENLGAAAARNRGLELANGSHILFCDNDVEFTPNWRNSLVSHLAAWPDIGAVGPVTDCGPPMQQIRKPGGSTSLTEWATDRALSHTDQFRYTNRLGGFCLMIRRDVIDDVGGFDEDFFPFGFEVDDFCVRLGLVGWRMRIIDHCAIAHQGRGRESTAVLGYEAVIERNWKHFKTNWNLPADLAVSELNLQHIVKSCPYDAEEHRIPYRSAEGYMEADEPVLLISTRQTLTGV